MKREDQIKKAAEIIACGCSDELKAALIKDFPEINESEDERIRKELWEYFHDIQLKCDNDFSPSFTIDDILAYLEKQKAQQPAEWSEEETELNSIAFLEQMGYTCIPPKKEQKPVEKQDYHGLPELERAIHRGFLCAGIENVPIEIIKGTAQECRLVQMKSALRPTWKPSEEQMKALGDVITMKRGNEYETTMLRTLYNDLKKLM